MYLRYLKKDTQPLLLLTINPSKTEINLNYNQRISPYHVVNTLRLGYKNQELHSVINIM
jgi:hypothetical protein